MPAHTHESSFVRRCLTLAVVLTAMLGTAGLSRADEEEAEGESESRNEVGVFLGAAIKDEHGVESGFTLGVGYEFRIIPELGAGALVEVATGGLRETLFLAFLTAHPWRGLGLTVGPGVDVSNEQGAQFALRLGSRYVFELGQFSLGPEFNVDLIDWKPVYVVGLEAGVSF